MTGADAVLEALDREGVDVVFGYPGGTIMPLYDALYGHKVRHVLVRHEAAAAFAAGGYARSSGRVGVCCATSGPGATNLVTGLCDASMDSVPVVAITGQVRSALMGTDGFQEADVCAIMQPVTKRTFLVRDVRELPATLAAAFALARAGRPGPVLVDIPTDVLKARLDDPLPIAIPEIPAARDAAPRVSADAIREAAARIRTARRPVAIIGGGVRSSERAVAAFRTFTELLGIPHAATINGLGAATPGNPHYLGMLGMHGRKAANLAVHQADVLLALGMRFDDRVTGRPDRFARDATVIHADIDPSEFGKIIRPHVRLQGELATTLEALVEELIDGHLPRFDDWAHQTTTLGKGLPSDNTGNQLSATDVLDAFFERAPADAVVTTDVGQHQMWAAQRARPMEPRSFVTSAGLGSMGFGFPAAVGAKFAHPDRPVFAVVGDGGFQMSLGELATLRRYRVPVKILLIDNRNLGMVRQWQELFYDERYSATNLSDNPDFVMIANAYGIFSERVEERAELAGALDKFIRHNGPALLHCACYPTENVWPMIPAGMTVDDLMEARS